MGVAIPLAKISQDEFVKRIDSLKAQALDLARTKYLRDVKDVVVRPLRPKDLGLTTDEWTFNVAAGKNADIVNVTLDDKTMVVIYGIYNLSVNPQVNEIVFKTGAENIEDVYFEEMYMFDQPAVLLDEAITYQPGSTIKMDFVAKGANTAEKIGFLGFVIEPAGRNIGK